MSRKGKRSTKRPSAEEESAGGTMMAFRRGFQNLAGTGQKKGPKSTAQKAWDIVFWLLIIAAAGYFLFGRR
jgi:hypothetical protein